jgi:hypothetical protein
MTAAEKYARALYLDTYRVLGRRMAHYTLGHALLLERLGSPFVTGNAVPGPGDLKLFLLLCSRSYPRALRLVKLSQVFPTWFRLRMAFFPLAYGLSPLNQVFEYLRESSSMPTRWEQEGAKAPGTPALQQVKLTLMSRLGYGELQALCIPLAKAFWDFFGLWEMEGKLELADPEDLAAVRQVIEEAKAEARNGHRPTDNPTTRN